MWSMSTGPMMAASASSTLVASHQAAHADFHDGDVDRRVGELPDGHGGEHFEEAHLRLAQLVHFHVHDGDKVLDLVPGVDEIVVGQLLAVDSDALVDVFQMGRGV